MAMFIRVKRKKTTWFLHCEPTETILEIKQKIQSLSDNPVDCQRLILLNSHQVLEDHKTLADQKGGRVADPRVHRIPTILRQPRITPAATPLVTSYLEKNGEGDVPTQHRMSTVMRVPYRPAPDEKDPLTNKDSQLANTFKDVTQRDIKKDSPNRKLERAATTRGSSKKDVEKNDRQGDSKKGVKVVPKKSGKEIAKNGGKLTPKEGLSQLVESAMPPKDTGSWEDISIEKLTDYSNLVDSD